MASGATRFIGALGPVGLALLAVGGAVTAASMVWRNWTEEAERAKAALEEFATASDRLASSEASALSALLRSRDKMVDADIADIQQHYKEKRATLERESTEAEEAAKIAVTAGRMEVGERTAIWTTYDRQRRWLAEAEVNDIRNLERKANDAAVKDAKTTVDQQRDADRARVDAALGIQFALEEAEKTGIGRRLAQADHERTLALIALDDRLSDGAIVEAEYQDLRNQIVTTGAAKRAEIEAEAGEEKRHRLAESNEMLVADEVEVDRRIAAINSTYARTMLQVRDAVALKVAQLGGDERAVREAQIKQLQDASGMTRAQAAAVVDERAKEEDLTKALAEQNRVRRASFETAEALYRRIAEAAATPGPEARRTAPRGGAAGGAGGEMVATAGGGIDVLRGVATDIRGIFVLLQRVERGLPLVGAWG
jgi:hypothetical protein